MNLVSALLDLDLRAAMVAGLPGLLGDEGPFRATPMMAAARTVPMAAVKDDEFDTVPIMVVAFVPTNMPAW